MKRRVSRQFDVKYFVCYSGEIGKKWKDRLVDSVSHLVDVIAVDPTRDHGATYKIPRFIRNQIKKCQGCIAILIHSNNMLPVWPLFEIGIGYGIGIKEDFFYFIIDQHIKDKKSAEYSEEHKLEEIILETAGHQISFEKEKIRDYRYVAKIGKKLAKCIWDREKEIRKSAN